MNTTITGAAGTLSRRIKFEYLALVAGLALAIGVGAATVAEQGQRGGSGAKPLPRTAPWASTAQPGEVVYYIVAGDADRDAMLSAINSEAQAGSVEDTAWLDVLVAGTSAERALLDYGVQELASHGIAVRVMDMTSSAASDADLASGPR